VIPHEGGLSTHVLDLVDGLRGQGDEVHVIHGGHATIGTCQRLVCMILALGSRDRYSCQVLRQALDTMAGLIREEIKAFAPDVVHCHDVYAASTVVDAVGGSRVPIVGTVHGPALYEAQMTGADKKHQYYKMIGDAERHAFAGATLLIAVDTGQAQILRDDYRVPFSRIVVIRNSVDVEAVRTLAQEQTSLAPAQSFFLVPRRLVTKTGVRYAIEALAKMARQDVHLVIAGDGPLRRQLQDLTAELQLKERVHFLGSVPRPQLLPLFSRAEAVIVPSVPASGVIEATSLAVMEAMACATVPIASKIGGLVELIQNGETGLLVAPGDSAALAGAMLSVLEDHPLRERLIRAGTHKVEAEYSTRVWLAKVCGVYQRAVALSSAGH
jgi:glycosyltransferase involved in cell wall biosynthesis